ncbi:MAG: pre-peptidase C-terminal domain-containing protein, partial [Candidatus Wallbacteria bacterium]|nr:pre-peptidase C-terminal domain-containing protein [Candidatus Wallbacteria bacterium]
PRAVGDRYVPGSYTFTITNSSESGSTPPGLTFTMVDDHPEDRSNLGAADALAAPAGPTPTTTTAEIGFPGDVDLFRFRAVADAIYLITTGLRGLGDSKLALLSSQGSLIASNDNFIEGTGASQIEYVVPPSRSNTDHILSVTGTGPTSVGTYTLTLTLDDHPGNPLSTIGRPQDLVPTNGSTANGTLQTTADVDCFLFNESEDTPYLIETVPSGNPGAVAETKLELLGTNGAVLATAISSAPGQACKITTVGDSNTVGTNFIRVSASGASATGDYGVRVSVAAIPIVTDVCLLPGPCPIAGSPVASNAGNFSITIVGVNVDNPTSVRFAELPGSEFSITSAGSGRITATLPARPPGQRFPPNVYHIQVTNGAGNVSPSTNRGVITLIDDHPETSAAITAADVLAVEGAPLAADIGFAGDVDFFRFTAQANIVYVVEALRSSPGDVGRMSIQVFNGASQLAAPNSFGGNSTFVSVRALQNGDLFLSLRAQTASQTGGYFVRVFKARRPAVTAVSPSRGLRDRVTAVTLTGSGFLGASQCLMAGTQLSTPDVSNDSSLATTVPAGIAPGNYDILVTNAVGVSNPGPAKFQVDDHPNGIAASGPDAIASPRDDLPINQPPVTATLETQNDRDVFAFQAIPAHTYTALTNLLSLSDTVLTVLAPDGSTVLAQQGALNASAGLFNSRVSFTAAQSGTHYARVETAGTGSGNYGLSISDPLSPDDHSNSAAQLNQLTDTLSDGVAALGSINYGGDVDYFAFTGTRGAIYDIETTLGSISDTVLTLFDQDGVTRLAENDDNPDNLTSRASKIIAFQPSASGTYYARVRHLTSDSDSFGTYTVKVTSRQGSLAVLAVRASQLSVSRGQTATLEVDIENTGRHRLTGLSAALDIRAGTTVRNSDYVLTADPANAAEFFPGQAVTLRYLARVSATATVGAVRIDARGSGLDDGAPVSDPSSFTTTSWTVQTPAAVTIANFTAPVQVSRGQSVVVTMNLDNAGQAAAAVDSVGLKFTGSGGVSRDSDYQVTPAPGNPPLLAPGIPSGSVSRSLRTPVRFLVTVKNTAVLEAVTINGFFRGRDANSGAALSRDTASTKSQWSVQTAAGLFIKSVTAPSAVSQDQTTQVVMNLQNPGQGSVTLSAAGLRFIDGLGNDLSADYTPTLATALPLSVPGLGRVSLLFNVIVTPNATRTTVLVDGAAAGRDDRTQAIVSLIRAEQPAEWTVQRAAGFSVDSLAVAPLAVSRGGTIVVTMAVRNTGEATAQITSSSVQFFAASGGASRTREYRITAAPANGKSLAGGASTTLTFSVLAGARATVGTLRVSGSVTGRDVNTAKLVTAASAPNSEPFFRLANIFVSITSPRSTDLLFFDGAIPFAATARDDSGASFSGATFTWRSSVSGLFGGGDSFSATLPAATHGVTVTASAGSGITSSTAVTLLVRPAPAPVGLLAVDGVLSRAASGSPLAAGFEIELTNASRGTRASYVTTDSTGRFRARFISTSGAVAGAGDVVTAQVREPVGLQRPTQPASFTIVSRDLALGARIQNFAADDLVEQLLSLRQGLNLIGLPINPATTSGTSFSADDLMRLTQSGFVSRLGKDSRTGRGRFEAAIAGLAGGFALEGNQGYLVQSPSDQVLSLRGTAWPPETLIRRMNKGLNFVALPLGVPPGFDAKGLLDLTTDGTLVSRLQPQITGISAFEVYVRNGAAPFAIESGKGYLLSVNSAGDLILRNAP